MNSHIPFTQPHSLAENSSTGLQDSFGRKITYVRLSVTDRCDLRCIYCMAEDMTFVPRNEVLSIEEITQLAQNFCELGVTKLRITGGEPLVRRGIVELVQNLGQLPQKPQLCMTTNGMQLSRYAQALKDAGLHKLNISLDSLNADTFKTLTRGGDVKQVLNGIRSAQHTGFKSIKLNCVALKHFNAQDANELVQFALNEGVDISFIEEMPLGKIDGHGRAAEFISSHELRNQIQQQFSLTPISETTGGPSRYWQVKNFASRIGFISPHSDNFCSSCNRVRVTATGRLILCLGQENSADLRKALREHPNDSTHLKSIIQNAMQFKPEKHDFNLNDEPQIVRFMNVTGG